MTNPVKTAAELLIEEAESRAITGGRQISLLTAIWAIAVAAEGGLHKLQGIRSTDWHDCPICGLNHHQVT